MKTTMRIGVVLLAFSAGFSASAADVPVSAGASSFTYASNRLATGEHAAFIRRVRPVLLVLYG